MGSVLIFNRKNSPRGEFNKDAFDVKLKSYPLSRQSLPECSDEKVHSELRSVVTLLETALEDIAPLIESIDGLEDNAEIRRAFALARLEVECARFSVLRLDSRMRRF